MDSSLKIATMNCRGLGNFQKRRDVFHFLREKKYSFYFLQDTHFHPSMESRIKAEWGYEVFFSSYTTNSRGVAILVNNNVECKVISTHRDTQGNSLMVRMKMFDKEFLLVNLYGPNNDCPEFYDNLEQMIRNVGLVDHVIMGGDYNLVMNFDLDCFNYQRRNNLHASERVSEMVQNLNLLDIFRELYPDVKRFTWRRTNPLKQSRLDFFLISDIICPYVTDVKTLPGYRSDHSMVVVEFQFTPEEKRNTFWKFNSSLLHDPLYIEEVNKIILDTLKDYAAYPYNFDNIETILPEDIHLTISDQLFLDVLLMAIRSKTISFSKWKNYNNKLQEMEIEKKNYRFRK